MAWHLLLYDASVENLHGSILAKHAIADQTAFARIAGKSDRTKVCHFVRARLLSTYNFLSIRSNQNDACILLTRCFEQIALLTINDQEEEESWIKPMYEKVDDKLHAEKQYQNKIFYPILQQLTDHKSYVSDLNVQSQLQINLQDFTSRMPINIQFLHFKTELNNPIHLQLPLNILRRILNSTDFLKMTKYIHDLSQFYVLLHQTYTKLIEQDQFSEVTLKQLYDRGQKYYKNISEVHLLNENKTHRSIIKSGIEAVNAYHQFADGLIRPGACDEMQRFTSITYDTPVSYLVTTDNHDEGDIVMRILSVLVDHHNNLLDLLGEEINSEKNNDFGPIRSLVNELLSKEVSVLQIMDDGAGVIMLNDYDYFHIEKLCRASLISKEEYFPTLNISFTFDFLYVQSYIIRKHFLHCRINYRHIIQKYQCYTRRKSGATIVMNNIETFNLDEKYSIPLGSQQLENDWNHLKEMLLDKLYHGHRLLRQIALILNDHENDLSSNSLYDFVGSIDDGDNIHQQLEQYQIKNFQLCHIDHVRKLYEKSINGFEHLFTDVSHLLRIPIDAQVNIELNETLKMTLINADYGDQIDKINETIQTITDFLNELKGIEDTLLQRSTQSLTKTCIAVYINNPILEFISENIKCENYVALNIHLIQVRSSLQERTININEKQMKLWHEDFHTNSQQKNCFQNYLSTENELISGDQADNIDTPENWEFFQMDNDYSNYDNVSENDLLLNEDYSLTQQKHPITTVEQTHQLIDFEDKIEYLKLFQLFIKFVPLTSSTFIQQMHEQRSKKEEVEFIPLTKAQKFIITHLDGKTAAYLWKGERLYEQLRKVFNDKKYDINTLAVIDKDEIFVDFTNNNSQLPHRILLEYYIIQKTQLVQVHFQFQTKLFEYLVTSNTNISTIIERFIHDNNFQLIPPDICLNFSNEFGKCINGKIIADISDKKIINIIVKEENADAGTLCEVTLHSKGGKHLTYINA
ncbi:unnamed protein product [Didymodactylos carnosus]|uniref:Uncharacterized protein n=1 Tax=Didymodactylos carnosus TaxID=1234261 RepID=A0A8S2Q0X3_9BILA|nr:unnamed protein product [Didymodactylos carnosus]CAF4080094.1 unnamed protein product [Didymodactylos carnosus]